ncbi:MAG TPA: PaaI family thioesterase, partial [Flavisolibacter sp.]
EAQILITQQGSVAVRVPAKDFLLRTSGIFHGGVIAAVADTAAGYAAVSCEPVDASFLTVEFKINFLSKAKGDWLEAKATVIKNGRTLTVVSVDVFVKLEDSEKKVATALVTLIKENI